MAEKILKHMYNDQCFNLLEFIGSSVYQRRVDHLRFMERALLGYKGFVSNMFLTLPPLISWQTFPDKLLSKAKLLRKDFSEFYSDSKMMLPCQMFNERIFPNLVWRNPLTPMFSIGLWNELYAHIGDAWFKFILSHGSLFILFPQACLFQITGKTAIDVYYDVMENEKDKRKLQFEETSACKRLKICGDAGTTHVMPRPTVNFHGTKLTMELTKILYSKNVVMAFPRLHELEKREKNDPNAASELITIIFQSRKNVLKTSTSLEFILKDPTIALLKNVTMIGIMQSFLRNHRKTHFLEMLHAHCPFDVSTTPTTKSYCSPIQIYSFLCAIIHRVIPPELFGSKHNKGKMQAYCKVFINASKGDQLSLEHLLYCMRIEDCQWIPEIVDEEERKIMFAVAMNWLFSDYLLTVLHGYFYITDFEGQKKRLFFYRKDVWKILQANLTMQLLIGKIIIDKRCQYQRSVATPSNEQFSCMGGGRLLPKKMWSRLILNLKPSKNLSSSLKTYLCALSYIIDKKFVAERSLIGCGVPCLPEFHKLWQKFVEDNRMEGKLMCASPLYFVKLDIYDCFSSVKLDLMSKVLQDACLFAEHNDVQEVDVYTYFVVSLANGRLMHQFKQVAVPKNGCFLTHLKDAGNCGAVLVDPDRLTTISVRRMMENLIFHLKNTSIELGEHHYRLMQGVAQGSLLSPILSSLYYGHMELKHLSEFVQIQRDGELLVRYVDDYFLVSPHRERAQKFLSTLHPGIPEYNCGTSCAKVVTNSDIEPNQENRCPTCAQKRSELIPWLGLLINSRTLEITGDFSQYANQSMAHTMTLDVSLGKKGLKKKMIFLIAPGNNCILFDGKVNGKKTIVKNLYEYSLLIAFRLHSLSTKLSKSEGADKHPDFYAELILVCVNQICVSLYKLRNHQTIVYPLRNCVSKWICLQAFIAKLKRHEMKYHDVLKIITPKGNDLSIKVGQRGVSYFQHVIGPKMPPVFKEIKV